MKKAKKRSMFIGKKVKLGCASFEDPLDCTIIDAFEDDREYVFQVRLESAKTIYIFSSDISWVEIQPEGSQLKVVQ